jgi:hypothetical protein
MLRGFFLIFFLAGIVIVAMCGFRGEHGQRTPWEIFPDMVRQQKVRAQAPLDFFADGRGPRVPIASTVPIGYEMPKPEMTAPPGITPSGAPTGEEFSRTRIGFSLGTDYYNTARWARTGALAFPSR